LLQKIRDRVSGIEGLSLSPTGIAVTLSRKPLRTTWDLLDLVGRHSDGCVIELDEVQELSVISGHLLKILANIFNTYSNIVFVFSGSMFGLMKTITDPGPASPLYGRPPAKFYLQPFDRKTAIDFLKRGFTEYKMRVPEAVLHAAVEERLDGIPGWLTLYGNTLAIRKRPPNQALTETVAEGLKIVRSELNHFLEGRDRETHMAALKAAATAAHWSEIKRAMEVARGSPVNDATVYHVTGSLKSAMLIQQAEERGSYRVGDPMLRTLLLTASSA
jgi:AAA+ ATPase superfamily predicted ATPase